MSYLSIWTSSSLLLRMCFRSFRLKPEGVVLLSLQKCTQKGILTPLSMSSKTFSLSPDSVIPLLFISLSKCRKILLKLHVVLYKYHHIYIYIYIYSKTQLRYKNVKNNMTCLYGLLVIQYFY
jgi:hypothetical protein